MGDSRGTDLPVDDSVPRPQNQHHQRHRDRYRVPLASAAAVAGFAVCLPLLATRNDPPREWGGVVLLGNTLLVVLFVLVVGGLLVALGRIRPMADAFGRGTLWGALLGGLLWAVLLMVLPGPTAAPSPLTPPPPWQTATTLPTGQR